jgi:hypothetical protein
MCSNIQATIAVIEYVEMDIQHSMTLPPTATWKAEVVQFSQNPRPLTGRISASMIPIGEIEPPKPKPSSHRAAISAE